MTDGPTPQREWGRARQLSMLHFLQPSRPNIPTLSPASPARAATRSASTATKRRLGKHMDTAMQKRRRVARIERERVPTFYTRRREVLTQAQRERVARRWASEGDTRSLTLCEPFEVWFEMWVTNPRGYWQRRTSAGVKIVECPQCENRRCGWIESDKAFILRYGVCPRCKKAGPLDRPADRPYSLKRPGLTKLNFLSDVDAKTAPPWIDDERVTWPSEVN